MLVADTLTKGVLPALQRLETLPAQLAEFWHTHSPDREQKPLQKLVSARPNPHKDLI